MVIDFHTHAFPDTLAERAIASLVRGSGGAFPPCSDGTSAGLISNMDRYGVDISVLQPVITKPSQTRTLNEWAAGVQCERIISFGGIHPDTDDYKRDIDFVKALGLRGLKFHCEYQAFTVDEPRMLKIYDYAFERGLMIIHHAGFDPAFKEPFRSSPEMFKNVARQMRGGVLIAAHLGGQRQWDQVERHLAGENIYLDTSMGFSHYPKDQFLRIAKMHGADKLLFGSDSPWSRADLELEAIRRLPLSEADRALILSKNAERLLDLKQL